MMPAMIADIADVPSDWLKWLVVVLIAVAPSLIALLKKSPSPVVTKAADEFAKAEGVARLAQRMDEQERRINSLQQSFTDRLHNMQDAILEKGEQRAIGIHGRIEPLAATVHDLAGKVDGLTMMMQELISRMPASVRKS